jgi:protease-4
MEKRFSGCLMIALGLILVISLLFNFGFLAFIGQRASAGSAAVDLADHHYFEEEYYSGNPKGKEGIAIIDLIGVIGNEVPGMIGESMVEDAKYKLTQAREDEDVKAVVLHIDSPGGEVLASDDLYRAVLKVRAVKPVVCYFGSVAASGGYYTAMGSSYIVANDLTITASIGVIMQTMNFKDLMDKVGVKALTFKSGKMKDLLNPTREPNPEEMKLIQELINETYDKFVGIVANERKLDEQGLRQGVADGRILSGKQALKEKLVDELGDLDSAIAKAEKLGKTSEARVIRYLAPFHWNQFLRRLGKSEIGSVSVKLPTSGVTLQTGRLYYLSPHLFGCE